jgi:hypothetical protein
MPFQSRVLNYYFEKRPTEFPETHNLTLSAVVL